MTNKEAIEILKSHISIYDCCKADHEANEAIRLAIKALEERPNAKWILKETEYDAGGSLYECTNCHHSDVHAESVEVPFCWYCGADMGGTKDDK